MFPKGRDLQHFSFFHLTVFQFVKENVETNTDKQISIMKFSEVFSKFYHLIIKAKSVVDLKPLIPQFDKHATYRKSTKYKNMREKAFY